jgi:uncharacterized protein YbjT (DUF2867 family)
MSTKKTIAVLGATGAQGGGLVRAILADPQGGFAARAITRHPESPQARELAKLGAEVVAADVDDEKSLERAFAGAHGVYAVTFFWAHMKPEQEIDEARRIAAAAKAAGVRHVVWSTLEDTRKLVPLSDNRMPTLMGRYKVPHFDAKGEANRAFTDAGVPTTFLLTSFYWDNLIHFGMGPKPAADGKLDFVLPMGGAKLPGIAAEDIGRCAYGVFLHGTGLVGQTVGIAGEAIALRLEHPETSLSEAVLEELFDPFAPLDPSSPVHEDGGRLRLALARALTTLCGGTLSVESGAGSGVTWNCFS